MRHVLLWSLVLGCLLGAPLLAGATGPNDGPDLDDDLSYDGYSPTGTESVQSENNTGMENEGRMDWNEVIEQIDNHHEAWNNFQEGKSDLMPAPGNTTVQPVYKHTAYATLKTARTCATLRKTPVVARCTPLAPPRTYRLKLVIFTPVWQLAPPAVQGE